MDTYKLEGALTTPLNAKKCPECKSDDLHYEEDTYTCLRCGHVWDR